MKLLRLYQLFFLRNLVVLLFLILIIFACTLSNPSLKDKDDSLPWLLMMIFVAVMPVHVIIAISNSLLVKKFFLSKKYKLFVPLFILYWFCAHYFLTWYYKLLHVDRITAISTLLTLILGIGIYSLHLSIMESIKQGRKDMMNVTSELSFLKQQLNPHFLLNAMNNLYGESLSAPQNLPQRILNLSGMLRYQIEATKRDLVLLTEEIEFIKKYIHYYTFRNELLKVTQHYEDNIEDIQIPPLLLLSLVENAVKFSAETPLPAISLDLKINGNSLLLLLENNFLESGSSAEGTGIGIENLKRRLEVYALKHELECVKRKDIFTIKLKIWGLSTAAL
ncbi:histidine kinase [Chryseobacterium sp. LC2016-27]|uniref:sensor histidine kinase n=1 Tax=Chryseobacterium sp. LC2016-27 TaxID=2897326 RepID=UPI001E3AD976|nr:histidine kinase [Chryseobacterium sp. LC2016-27]MCD0456402.1 histidine kinase [Chryseobacterium sp. LC2016-27]